MRSISARFRDTAIVIVLAVVLVIQGSAGAHSKLLRAEPAPNSTLRQPPRAVKLWFSLTGTEELDVKQSTLSVVDSSGRRVDDGKGGVDLNDMDRRSMIAALKPIGAGVYAVRWKAVSSPDLDVRRGSFRFTVASGAAMKLPPLRIVSPKEGATVRNPVAVVFETSADLSKMTVGGMKEKENLSHDRGTMSIGAHLHIELDKRLTMPTMKHLTRIADERFRFGFGQVKPGPHTIRVYWADHKGHKPLSPVQTVTVTVAE